MQPFYLSLYCIWVYRLRFTYVQVYSLNILKTNFQRRLINALEFFTPRVSPLSIIGLHLRVIDMVHCFSVESVWYSVCTSFHYSLAITCFHQNRVWLFSPLCCPCPHLGNTDQLDFYLKIHTNLGHELMFWVLLANWTTCGIQVLRSILNSATLFW